MSTRIMFGRLAVMMLLQYAIFGGWYATVGLVLSTNNLSAIIGLTFSAGALGAIVSPLLVGAVADRFFSTQQVLGVLHLGGGVLLLLLPRLVATGNAPAFLGVVFAYMVLFQPTVGLTNTIAFTHLGDKRRLFPLLRVFGTLGWVLIGLVIGQTGLSASTAIFIAAAACSFALGLYSFFLPATPPPQKGVAFSWGDVVAAKAFRLLKRPNFIIFSICSLLICIPIALYNGYASTYLSAIGIDNVASVLIIGQASELVFISLLPILLARLGMKWVLVLGMLTWGVRFGLFMLATNGQVAPSIMAVALHGICNDFFLVVGFMYVDRVAGPQIKAQGQSYLVFMTQGVGTFLGALLAGWVFSLVITPGGSLTDWITLWSLPTAVALACAVAFIVLFKPARDGLPGSPAVPGEVVRASGSVVGDHSEPPAVTRHTS